MGVSGHIAVIVVEVVVTPTESQAATVEHCVVKQAVANEVSP
jgi:hypothetical protein